MARGIQTTRPTIRKTSSRNIKEKEIPQQTFKVPEQAELLDKLLDKFPDYDMAWNDTQKTKWLEGFILFMQKIYLDNKK